MTFTSDDRIIIREIVREVVKEVREENIQLVDSKLRLHLAECPTTRKVAEIRAVTRGMLLGYGAGCTVVGGTIVAISKYLFSITSQ